MTIAIDCRMINSSGVGVYLRGVLAVMLRSPNDFILLGNSAQLEFYKQNTNVCVIECNVKPFSLRELFFFPEKILEKINFSTLFYSPYFNIPGGIIIPVYTTIHDIIFPDMPELVSRTGLAARMWFYRRAYQESLIIFTVSNFSKSRIEHHFGTKKPVIVTYCAIQPFILSYRDNNRNIQKTETIVYIGNIKKHKGLDCLLEAFLSAKKEGLPHRLLIIGTKENFRSSDGLILKKIESIENGDVTFTGFISDEELLKYLSEAALLVQPSLYEGFGFPPLEALVLGTRSLISDIPVFKEIYEGFPVIFFHAGDSADLKNKMMEILGTKKQTPKKRTTKKQASKEQFFPVLPVLSDELLNKYTFEKTVHRILEAMQ
jgi:glycosyltransferase involved in cell wall biosynthesis